MITGALLTFGSCVGVGMSSKSRRIEELETICGRLREEVMELRSMVQSKEIWDGLDASYDATTTISLTDLRNKIDMSNSYWDW